MENNLRVLTAWWSTERKSVRHIAPSVAISDVGKGDRREKILINERETMMEITADNTSPLIEN